MRWLRSAVARVHGLLTTTRRERDLADEIESHLQMHTDDNIRSGMPPDGARRAAILKLGGVEALKEQHRDQRGWPFVAQLGQDLRYAVRTARRNAAVTIVALVTLALGIAGPTIMFTMIKAWILDPLPFPQPDALIDVRGLDTTTGDLRSLNPADFQDWRRQATSFADLAGYRSDDTRVTDGTRAESVAGAAVTPNFFTLLDPGLAAGQAFARDARDPAAVHIAVISDAFWRDHFVADPGIVGRSVRLDGVVHTIVGVLPPDFHFTLLGRAAVWTPLVFTPEEAADRRPRSLVGVARLGDGHSIDQARDQVERIARSLASSYPDTNGHRGARVVRLSDEIRRHHDLGFLVPVLFAMVCCVLLVACVNVTNVMLARATARRHEIAVRLALGASTARIIRQWLVEHVALFVLAGALGAALAVYGTHWITNAIPYENRGYLRHYGELTVDWGVLAFAIATGTLCGLAFGWLTAWAATRGEVSLDVRSGAGRTTIGKRGTRLRGTLVAVEVAFALALLVSATMLAESARNLTQVDLGFSASHLLTFRVRLDEHQYTTDVAIAEFGRRLADDLSRRPGVAGAAAGSRVPFSQVGSATDFVVQGRPEPAPKDMPSAALNHITADYPAVLGLRLVRGRFLNGGDRGNAPKVAMVNDAVARRYFPSGDALGQRLTLSRTSPDPWTIVGIVGDVKNYEAATGDELQIYVPFAAQPVRQMTMVLRATGDTAALVGAARDAVASLDAAEPLSHIFTMDALIGQQTAPYVTTATFASFFGAVTLLLAGVGVYGVIAYSFSQRTREIGIRMALGARRADVAALVVGQLQRVLVAGFVPGLVIAWLIGRALQSFLVGVTPTDWGVYLWTSLALACVAGLAAVVPARRAASVNPTQALHCE